jgi:hypothetical protein
MNKILLSLMVVSLLIMAYPLAPSSPWAGMPWEADSIQYLRKLDSDWIRYPVVLAGTFGTLALVLLLDDYQRRMRRLAVVAMALPVIVAVVKVSLWLRT